MFTANFASRSVCITSWQICASTANFALAVMFLLGVVDFDNQLVFPL